MNETFQKIFSTLTILLVALIYSVQRQNSVAISKVQGRIDELIKLTSELAAKPSPVPSKSELFDVPEGSEARKDAQQSEQGNQAASAVAPADSPKAAPGEEGFKVPPVMAEFVNKQMVELELNKIKEAISITADQEERLRIAIAAHPLHDFSKKMEFDLEKMADLSRERDNAIIEVIGKENYETVKADSIEKFERIMAEEKERRDALWQQRLELTDEQKATFSKLIDALDKDTRGNIADLNPDEIVKNPNKMMEVFSKQNEEKTGVLIERSIGLLNEKQQATLKDLSQKGDTPFGSAGRFHPF